jgi:uncharacterized membrane protein HdeD (DUF308 family)
MRDDRDVGQPTGSRPSGGDGLRLASGIVGAVGVLAGLAAIVLPHATLFAVSWVFGISLVVSGAALVVTGGVVAFSWPRPAGERAGLPVPGP